MKPALAKFDALATCSLELGAVLLALLCLASAAQAQLYSEPKAVAPQGKPTMLQNIGIDQRLDQQVPLDLKFRDEAGQPGRLCRRFGSKPAILTLVYYTCPMLCNEVQSGLGTRFVML